jgi:hypothetical protein
MRKATRISVMLATMLVAVSARPASAAMLDFSLDTAALIGAGQFQIDFQLVDGSGAGDGSTLIQLLDINGTFIGAPLLAGGASGDVATSVTLTDTEFFNAFTAAFTAGPALTFRLLSTATSVGPPPDLFTVSLLRYALPDGTPTLEFYPLLDLEFADPRSLWLQGVPELNLAAPEVSAATAPEPALLALGALAGACMRLRRRHH